MVATQVPFLQTTLLSKGVQNHLYKVLLAQASRKEQIVLICFDRKNMKELYRIWHKKPLKKRLQRALYKLQVQPHHIWKHPIYKIAKQHCTANIVL